jgi:hypothetical protein
MEVAHNAEIIRAAGDASPQCDIAIIDEAAPMLQDLENHRIIPAECVYGVIEVKYRLDGKQIIEACNNIRDDQAAPFIAVGGQRGVDRVRRDHRAELGTGGAVAGAGTLGGTGDDVPGGEDYRVPADHGVSAEVGNEVKQPSRFPDG